MKKKILYLCFGVWLVFLPMSVNAAQKYYVGENEWFWITPDYNVSSINQNQILINEDNHDVIASKGGIVSSIKSEENNMISLQITHPDGNVSVYQNLLSTNLTENVSVIQGQVIGVSSSQFSYFILGNSGIIHTFQPNGLNVFINRLELIDYGKQFIGNPYVYGGNSLTNGIDCSGFTKAIYHQFGVELPRTAQSQYQASIPITKDELQPGDLIFYGDNIHSITHVTMYIGNNQVLHASNSKPYPEGGIKISDFSYRTPIAYGRFLPE